MQTAARAGADTFHSPPQYELSPLRRQGNSRTTTPAAGTAEAVHKHGKQSGTGSARLRAHYCAPAISMGVVACMVHSTHEQRLHRTRRTIPCIMTITFFGDGFSTSVMAVGRLQEAASAVVYGAVQSRDIEVQCVCGESYPRLNTSLLCPSGTARTRTQALGVAHRLSAWFGGGLQ
jgi:hypothetical protein